MSSPQTLLSGLAPVVYMRLTWRMCFVKTFLDKSFAAVPPYIPSPKGRGFYGGLDKSFIQRK
jgi:hypothetical protein